MVAKLLVKLDLFTFNEPEGKYIAPPHVALHPIKLQLSKTPLTAYIIAPPFLAEQYSKLQLLKTPSTPYIIAPPFLVAVQYSKLQLPKTPLALYQATAPP